MTTPNRHRAKPTSPDELDLLGDQLEDEQSASPEELDLNGTMDLLEDQIEDEQSASPEELDLNGTMNLLKGTN